ncbi:MAG: hypothetical protein GKR89_17295 [Candidatus Latescibacteria bacterium]|nr:hypothetical protein [Candidatus Latescibacterota bacterium]
MKRIFFCLLVSTWLGVTSGGAEAPPAYSLEALVERALEYGGAMEEARWRFAGARADYRKKRASRFLPRLRLESENGLVPDAEGDIFNPPSDTSGLRPLGPFHRSELEFVQPLYAFGRFSSLGRAAQQGFAVEQATFDEDRLDLILEVKGFYYNLLLARDLNDLVQRLARRIAKEQESLEAAETASLVNQFKLELSLLELQARQREAELKLDLAGAALRWKVGLPADASLNLQAEWLEPLAVAVPALDTLVEQARTQRPDWRMLQAGIAARHALLDASRQAFLPQIYVGGGIRYALTPGRTDQRNPFVKDEFNYFRFGAFLGFRQDLEWGQMRAEVAKSKAEFMELKAKEKDAREGIRIDVQNTYVDYQQAETELRRSTQARKLTRQWLRLAQDEYELTEEFADLIAAFPALAQAEQEYIEAVHAFNMSLAHLERATGGMAFAPQSP